jgi:hypothetical protein
MAEKDYAVVKSEFEQSLRNELRAAKALTPSHIRTADYMANIKYPRALEMLLKLCEYWIPPALRRWLVSQTDTFRRRLQTWRGTRIRKSLTAVR